VTENRPVIVGLFGGIASGKSCAAKRLRERGARVLDADRCAHEELLRPEVRSLVAEALGPAALDAEGKVDRRAVSEVVFREPAKLRALEAILHPRVMARLAEEIAAAGTPPGAPRAVVALDVPLLAEAGGLDWCDERLFVDAPLEARRARALARGWAPGELERREARQRPLDEKRALATCVIDNGGDEAALASRVDRFWDERVAPRLAPP